MTDTILVTPTPTTIETKSHIPGITGTALDFDIKEFDVYLGQNGDDVSNFTPAGPCKDKKGIAKLDDDGNVSDWWIVGDGYKAKSHKDYYNAIEHQLVNNIDPNHLAGCEVSTRSSRNGKWGLRNYVFPNVGVPIETRTGFKTQVSLRIVAWSGLDGSCANNYILGAFDGFCTNGMIFTQAANRDEAVSRLYKRNSKNFNLDSFAKTLMSSTEVFYKQAEQIQIMADTNLSVDNGMDFIESIKSFSKAKKAAMQDLFINEVVTRGTNVFALHSALTNYSSHMNANHFRTRTTKHEDSESEILFKREIEISDVLNSNQWNELLAA